MAKRPIFEMGISSKVRRFRHLCNGPNAEKTARDFAIKELKTGMVSPELQKEIGEFFEELSTRKRGRPSGTFHDVVKVGRRLQKAIDEGHTVDSAVQKLKSLGKHKVHIEKRTAERILREFRTSMNKAVRDSYFGKFKI